jgi:hypothetical protein
MQTRNGFALAAERFVDIGRSERETLERRIPILALPEQKAPSLMNGAEI